MLRPSRCLDGVKRNGVVRLEAVPGVLVLEGVPVLEGVLFIEGVGTPLLRVLLVADFLALLAADLGARPRVADRGRRGVLQSVPLEDGTGLRALAATTVSSAQPDAVDLLTAAFLMALDGRADFFFLGVGRPLAVVARELFD